MPANLTIGEISDRTGLAVSAIRYYEDEGLIRPFRNSGNQRRFDRADIRRLSFVKIAQELGFPLADIRALLKGLPDGRAPTKADWTRISRALRADLDARIAQMVRLRDRLDGCIGCGCLSLKACKLYNNEDRVRKRGPGARLVIEDKVE